MAYEVLARKWRPAQFDDVVGQEHVTHTLRNALRSERVAHAYLFVGPRGIGKTSIARIFAKALNCSEGPTDKPCDKCNSCLEIAAGNSLDVMEIDGASNRGIDEIRELRESVKYLASGRFKLYIIDEVHMLTTEAFNALLKTLEEPPKHVKFFFATTEPQKVPATILSRCQRFDLRRISTRAIFDRLKTIVDAEKIKVEEEALLAVARASDGGLRDAESALDQLISFCGKQIKEEDVLSVFGLVSSQVMGELISAILAGDVAGVIRIVEDLDANGKDMQRVLLELLEYQRNLLVWMHVGKDGFELELVDSQIELLEEQAKSANVDRILRMTDVLVETNDRLKFALSPKTLLETALIRCARSARVASLDEILAQVRQLKSGIPGGTGGSGASIARETRSSVSAGASAQHAVQPNLPSAKPMPPAGTQGGNELERLENQWPAIVDRVGAAATLARSILVDSKPVSVSGDSVVVGFDPEFSDKATQANVPRNRNALKTVLKQVLRRQVNVKFVVLDTEGSSDLPSDHPVSNGHGGKNQKKNERGGSGASLAARQKWLENETVRKVLETFDGSIVDVRE